ncbi:MAG TPA: sulfatase-like hydrolase/transferase, partial [Solirubrobacterales bacterium]|nr:sulfatase-like hydrolase/transferase [Solirubrobacterales bacterium]
LGNNPPRGGWHGFRASRAYRANLATWLQGAGYRTIHIGKFLNHYGTDERPEPIVPPGWNVWQTDATDNSGRFFYGYTWNIDGRIAGPFGDPEYGQFKAVDRPGCFLAPVDDPGCNHKTDEITRRAVDQIEIAAELPAPIYMQLDYNAPHGDHQPPIGPEPTPRNYGRADRTPIPRGPAFNEADVSDKPSFIRDHAERFGGFEMRRIRVEYRKSLESLRDVDDGVRRIIATLRRTGELQNTYILFTSDNGFFRGEHRLDRAKFLPYEPAVRMPLLIRGPAIPPGIESEELSGNIDLAPTLLELARARPTYPMDGRSLAPFWRDPERTTRRPILLESFANATAVEDAPGSGDPNPPTPPDGYTEPDTTGASAGTGRGGSAGTGRGGSAGASKGAGAGLGPSDGTGTGRAWRHEPGRGTVATASIAAPVKNYGGVRLGRYKYVEYETGDIELYDLARDPHEIQNRAGFPAYRWVQGFLAHQLRRLVKCSGRECKFRTGPIPLPGEPRAKLRWAPRQPLPPRR